MDSYGRSLALFGLPLTEMRRQGNPNGDVVMRQWFQRARLEWHPGNPDQFKVLLGLLGNDAGRRPGPGLTTYTHSDGSWSVQYPADLLMPKNLGGGVVIFISLDRGTVASVDSYVATGNEYGNTGEDLRNRARDTLARIYGQPVNETRVLAGSGRFDTGVAFTTDKGSKGEALYDQELQTGDNRVNGFLFGYKATTEGGMLPRLQAMRNSFTPPATPSQDLLQARATLIAYHAHA